MEESLSFDHDYVGHNNLYILNLLNDVFYWQFYN
jgi:hypothetical protein